MRWSWALGCLLVVGAAIGLIGLALAEPAKGPPEPSTALAAVASLPSGPPGLGRCGAVLNATDDRRRLLAARLVRALDRAGHPIDATRAAASMAAACQTAPPGSPVTRALARLVELPRPLTRVCRALRRDRRDLMRTSAGPLAAMRRADAMFDDLRRPGLDAVHGGITGSGRRARSLAARLDRLPMRTADGRSLRRELRLLLADWANHARAYGGRTPDAATLVREVGAAEAVDRLRRWLDGTREVRERAQRVERAANRSPSATSPACDVTRIYLFDA